ncbi:hypothetical protein CC2G_006623 [Coprinopsis cinerea AmutBmut pab1-1]|nr:hypothetical protein CC2G_006623 [Coprinopsis cinerea AmutBmut pab1-1]
MDPRRWRRGAIQELYRLKHQQRIQLPHNLRPGASTDCDKGVRDATQVPLHDSLHSVPNEVAVGIILDVLQDWFLDVCINSFTYSFVPIRRIFSHPLSSVCRAWRDVYLHLILCSPVDRISAGGDYIGCTVEELVTVQKWLPGINIQGCLVFLGDPNGPLSTLTPVKDSTLIPSDPSIQTAIEAIEWVEPGTVSTPVASPPDIVQATLEVCRDAYQKVDPSSWQSQTHRMITLRNFLVDEYLALGVSYCSQLVAAIDSLPNLKRAELPAWIWALAYTTAVTSYPPSVKIGGSNAPLSTHDGRHLVDLVGEPVTSAELAQQLETLMNRVNCITLVGYPFSILGVFLHGNTYPKELQHYLVNPGEQMVQFLGGGLTQLLLPLARVPMQTTRKLKTFGWRSTSQCETAWFENLLIAMMEQEHTSPSPASAWNLEHLHLTNNAYWGHTPTAFMSIPLIQQSSATLRTLILSFKFATDVIVVPPLPEEQTHQCLFLRQFDELLPNIEYFDITVYDICPALFSGIKWRPKKRGGTFILTRAAELWYLHPCPNGPFAQGQVALEPDTLSGLYITNLLDLSKSHFEEMQDWDVQIRVESRECITGPTKRRLTGRNEEGPSKYTIAFSPFSDVITLRRLRKRSPPPTIANSERCGSWDQLFYRTTVSKFTRWVRENPLDLSDEVTAPRFRPSGLVHWLEYPWGIGRDDDDEVDEEDEEEEDD